MNPETTIAAPALIRSSLTAWALDGVHHGFMTRRGGVSSGVYAELNLAGWIEDDPAAVTENWRRWDATYPAMKPAWLNQVHGNRVIVASDHGDARPEADGIVATERGLALCIFTADCVPALLIDSENQVIGALHSGWRSTIADIASVGVRTMIECGARVESIRASLGPSIGSCCFEVDAELADRFAAEISGADRHSRPGRTGKAYLDLRAIVRDQLMSAGVDPSNIVNVGPCTKCSNDHFFSRRANGGKLSGLQMSFIGFAP
ncbi:MAG TPA: peptidoglycan editing factor PgeF [Candidatus Binataceae bacterium]|nr:peptidoglycan editing factor PgeF [Candidatus Binataceae bacterium]